jgi:hypothetical protein
MPTAIRQPNPLTLERRPTMGSFRIDGIDGLSARLQGIAPADVAGMARATEHLHGQITSRAPVDTGHLRDSYQTSVEDSGDGAVGRVFTSVEYSIFQEYGTRYQGGTAHVRPALDANRQQLVEMMAAGIFE